MGIKVNEEKKIFQLNTPNTTYLMGVARDQYLGHMYRRPPMPAGRGCGRIIYYIMCLPGKALLPAEGVPGI